MLKRKGKNARSHPPPLDCSLWVGGGERTGQDTLVRKMLCNRLVSHPYRFSLRNGAGLSLTTEKHLETNGKRPVDIRIQTKTDPTRNFLQRILDTSHFASVRILVPVPWPAGLSSGAVSLGCQRRPSVLLLFCFGDFYAHLSGQPGHLWPAGSRSLISQQKEAGKSLGLSGRESLVFEEGKAALKMAVLILVQTHQTLVLRRCGAPFPL